MFKFKILLKTQHKTLVVEFNDAAQCKDILDFIKHYSAYYKFEEGAEAFKRVVGGFQTARTHLPGVATPHWSATWRSGKVFLGSNYSRSYAYHIPGLQRGYTLRMAGHQPQFITNSYTMQPDSVRFENQPPAPNSTAGVLTRIENDLLFKTLAAQAALTTQTQTAHFTIGGPELLNLGAGHSTLTYNIANQNISGGRMVDDVLAARALFTYHEELSNDLRFQRDFALYSQTWLVSQMSFILQSMDPQSALNKHDGGELAKALINGEKFIPKKVTLAGNEIFLEVEKHVN